MCMTPVSPDTTPRARASSAPVSWSENSPAALATAPPPSATSCCASPRSSGPPTMTGRYPAAPSRSARALQCATGQRLVARSEEHTSELQSRLHLVCRLLLEKKKEEQTHAQKC